jgi:signal transduction histidine kinase
MEEPFVDLLVSHAMPELAAALRATRERIMQRWNALVRSTVPEADELTTAQVRDSLPKVLDQVADALEVAAEEPTRLLLDLTRAHGGVRFHESYNVKELIVEYRILRRVVFEEIQEAMVRPLEVREWMALDVAVDIAVQQSVIAFIEHQKLQLKSATEAEAKFLAFLAHDLRNSLNSILLTMQWVESSLLRYNDLREEREGLQGARQSATATIDSMERLLQAERLRKGVEVRREKVRLADLAGRVLGEARRSAGERPLTFENRIEPAAEIISDSGLLTVILQNLLGNAVKYSARGRIAVESQYIEDSVGQAWRLTVSDQGPGIPPDRVDSLFHAFTRGDTHGQPGVGLGLFIASQAARLLGSRLEVDSQVGQGARFSVLLRNLPAPDAV